MTFCSFCGKKLSFHERIENWIDSGPTDIHECLKCHNERFDLENA